jgi:hypothetical protein
VAGAQRWISSRSAVLSQAWRCTRQHTDDPDSSYYRLPSLRHKRTPLPAPPATPLCVPVQPLEVAQTGSGLAVPVCALRTGGFAAFAPASAA